MKIDKTGFMIVTNKYFAEKESALSCKVIAKTNFIKFNGVTIDDGHFFNEDVSELAKIVSMSTGMLNRVLTILSPKVKLNAY